jgi:hypothetical protein
LPRHVQPAYIAYIVYLVYNSCTKSVRFQGVVFTRNRDLKALGEGYTARIAAVKQRGPLV